MKVRLVKIVQESPVVRRFFLEPATGEAFTFSSGQFVILTLPDLPQNENTRSYSIASAPNDSEIELCISLNKNGKATPAMWQLEVGAELEMSQPQGNFVFREEQNVEVCFICTGTGVAPFRSMIISMLQGILAKPKKLFLIFGNRNQEDILYRTEFETWQKEHSWFEFIPVLSREEDWNGAKGYVHQIYQNQFADGRDARFYVCGWKNMCVDARDNLKQLGYNRRQYFFEDYG